MCLLTGVSLTTVGFLIKSNIGLINFVGLELARLLSIFRGLLESKLRGEGPLNFFTRFIYLSFQSHLVAISQAELQSLPLLHDFKLFLLLTLQMTQ